MCSARTRARLLLLVLCACPLAASAAGRYDPKLRFRTMRTAHFDVHAHQGEEAMARRLAAIVERVRTNFEPVFGVPRGRVQVILVDQTDVSNGWATPAPYNTIEITAVPPSAESLIGNTTDWLELVFSHEYTHILHLDRSRGIVQGVRRVFGRVPVVFPNNFLPVWQVEGIATFEESRMTGEGRIPAGDFRAIVDAAAVRGQFEPIDRASGGLVAWPSGNAAYAYGAYFHQYLADRYGPEKLAALADATSGRVPLFGSGAFKNVFGRSEGDLWNDFRAAREGAAVPPSSTEAHARRLTHHGFAVTAPAIGPDGIIYYGLSNADGFPSLMALAPAGVPRRLAWRVSGNRTSVRGDWIVFDQLQRVRSVALYSDLYAVHTAGGAVRRLTRDARAADPDLSPDGRQIVCTLQSGGRRALALVEFSPDAASPPRVLVDDPQADYTGPRWSPDGRQIVAERRRAGVYELVLIDPGSRAVRTLVARSDARLVTPSWTADGAAILFSADISTTASRQPDEPAPFNVFAVDLASLQVRQITDTRGGAQFPLLSPSGTLTYVGYTTDGYDLFSVPVDAGAAAVATSAPGWDAQATAARGNPAADSHDGPYHPGPTLLPTSWTPVIESDAGETLVGAGTATYDALGRHAYALDAAWASSRARPDWHAAYAYDRWRPTLFTSYSDDTDPVRGGLIRTREWFAGALLPFRHVRWTETLLAGFDAETDSLSCAIIDESCGTPGARRDFRSVRGGWLHDSRRRFGYSVSPEEGFAIETAVETSRASLGSDADSEAAVLDARGYWRLFRRHTVLAGRIAGAGWWGPAGARRLFAAGGSGPSVAAFDFGRDTIGLLRGFAPEDIVGTRAAVANLDLRFPIARIERGFRSWPIFFRTLHAAAFADAGNAWDSQFRAADLRTSAGGELALDLVVLHYLPLTLVSGAAWTRDPVNDRQRAAFFARIGYAF